MQRPESGLDCLIRSKFARQRSGFEVDGSGGDYLQWSEMAEEALEPVEAFEETRWSGEPPCHC